VCINNIFLLGNLSTITPPKSVNRSDGRVASAATRPIRNAELVSFKTSQPSATICSHVPMRENNCPLK